MSSSRLITFIDENMQYVSTKMNIKYHIEGRVKTIVMDKTTPVTHTISFRGKSATITMNKRQNNTHET